MCVATAVLDEPNKFFIFSLFLKIFTNRPLVVSFLFMDPDLSTIAFGVEETRLGAMDNCAEVLARRRTWW